MKLTAPTMLLLGALAILSAGCVTTDTAATSSAVCSQWRGISWSVQDTPQTITEVKASNARRKAWGC